MSTFQNEHGVWCVRKKVPKRLEEAVAVVMGRDTNGIKRNSQQASWGSAGHGPMGSKERHIRPTIRLQPRNKNIALEPLIEPKLLIATCQIRQVFRDVGREFGHRNHAVMVRIDIIGGAR
jgi:hypothetical protein